MKLRTQVSLFFLTAIAAVALIGLAARFPLKQDLSVSTLPLWTAAGAEIILVAWALLISLRGFKPVRAALGDMVVVRGEVERCSARAFSLSMELSDDASTQAASLEQTAASLEQIMAMTIRNSENADQGRSLMERTERLVEQAEASMDKTRQAMGEIGEASARISKVVQQIDKIAFRTNLLALNAAVEAARAGEHGAGFAVVAQEVRQLAQSSSKAARETQELIGGTQDKIEGGIKRVGQTATDFKEMACASAQAAALVKDIAGGSTEQCTGLEQITAAMGEIDGVTQSIAAQAANSARVSEEMETQTQALRQALSAFTVALEGGHQRKEAEILVKKALQMAKRKGLKNTLDVIATEHGPLMKGDEMYVYAGSMERVTLLAHPVMPEKLVGPDLSRMADIKGKYFFHELIDVARSRGEGWVDYWWPRPGEEEPSLKSTYLTLVPGEPVYFACGIYA
ncbi:MAG: cache domain-containing protein [Deltaproteobacteria bacterium]|nr:cache domain-containing protein [Deltaproteobacteria bacterium]